MRNILRRLTALSKSFPPPKDTSADLTHARIGLAERWVRSVKQECLSKLILFGQGPVVRTLAEFSAHYHGERNHQGKGNKLLFPDAGNKTSQRGHAVQCHQRLGGLLKFYGRAA